MNRIPLLALAAFFGLPGLVSADAGFTSANFLKIGMGARAAAMADSFTALSDDATAIYWNPAGLTQAQGTQLSLTHTQWLQGVNLDFAALSQNLGSEGTVGLGFTVLGLQSFVSTVEDSSGNFAGSGPSVSAGDWELSVGYSNRLSRFIPGSAFDRTLVGLTVNLVGQNESGPMGTGLSFDLGAIQLFPKDHFSLGLDVVNIGTSIQDRSQPLDFKLGASWYHPHNFNSNDKLTLAADVDLNSDTGLQPRLGSEYRLPLDKSDIGFLRAGLRTTDNVYGFSFLALGAGLEHVFSGFVADLDYAFVPYGTIGPTHRFTLSMRLGNMEKKISAELSGPTRFYLDSPTVALKLGNQADETVATWNLVFADDKGQTVQKFTGTGEPPSAYTWNARNLSGDLVAPGTYTATLQVKDTGDRVANASPIAFQAVGPLSLNNVQWTLSSDVAFGIAKANLSKAGKNKLTSIGEGLKKYFGDIGVEIQGYTDNKPCRIGPHCKFKNNQELSEARAKAVKDLFVRLGLKPENLTIVGFAEINPVASNETPEGRAQNRRIQVKIKTSRVETPDSVSNAGIFLMDNGQAAQALELFKLVVDHTPEKPEPYLLMADCYLKMGNLDEAQKAQDEAKKLGGKPAPAK
jgi:outer membrane protein OmpA-like peptidoglycan-associated protein